MGGIGLSEGRRMKRNNVKLFLKIMTKRVRRNLKNLQRQEKEFKKDYREMQRHRQDKV